MSMTFAKARTTHVRWNVMVKALPVSRIATLVTVASIIVIKNATLEYVFFIAPRECVNSLATVECEYAKWNAPVKPVIKCATLVDVS